jgi:hypothetical protein
VLRPFVGVLGSIQPDVLDELAENREDGMLERFLFAYPDAINARWTEDEIGEATIAAYNALCEQLRQLNMDTDKQGDPVEVPLVFSPEAKETFVQVYNEHRDEMASVGFPQHLRAAFAKLEAYLLRLTLIMAACRFVQESEPERIESTDVPRAVLVWDYFKSQARRIFGALRGFDEKLALFDDVCTFVHEEHSDVWTGTPTELHDELRSAYKPSRPDELSKFLQETAQKHPKLIVESDFERWKDKETGEWKGRRVLSLYLDPFYQETV